MKHTAKRAISILLAVITAVLSIRGIAFAEPVSQNYKSILNDSLKELSETVTEPAFGTIAGEWSVLCLARSGFYPLGDKYFSDYYSRIEKTVSETAASVNKKGALHKNKSTENARLILALSAIGMDSTDVGGIDLIEAYSANGISWIERQGINGVIFALIALDTKNYKTSDEDLRSDCISKILFNQLSDGGWNLSGDVSDIDTTAMALQALANYRNVSGVSEAAEKAFAYLSKNCLGNGTSESLAQIIVAATAWGIDPGSDSRFIKDGVSSIDSLLDYYVESGKGFAHVLESGGGYTAGEINGMSTDQCCYALIAYDRFLNGKNSLYDMSDAVFESKEINATVTAPEKVKNEEDSIISVKVYLDDFPEGYQLFDCIMNVPDCLSVSGITVGSAVSGGTLSYNYESETGKLRIVYFDAQNLTPITVNQTGDKFELFTVNLRLNGKVSAAGVSVSIPGMTIKKDSEAAQIVVNTANTAAVVALSNETLYKVYKLYSGDGIDLIPAEKTAIAVTSAKSEPGSYLGYSDENGEIVFYYCKDVSEKYGISTYMALIDSSRSIENMQNENNYKTGDGENKILTFGDLNGDGIINAQDALKSVDIWLRKTDALSDFDILSANVTGDNRINTFDALALTEKFTSEKEFGIVSALSLFLSTEAVGNES